MHLISLIIKCFAEKIEKVAKNPSQSVISEIRSYAKPPKAVHDIMLCVYLLLGDEEDQLKVRIDILWKVYSCKIKIFPFTNFILPTTIFCFWRSFSAGRSLFALALVKARYKLEENFYLVLFVSRKLDLSDHICKLQILIFTLYTNGS